MAKASWDVIIVGQGLAGTTLAWQLRLAGQRVLIFDTHQSVTASKIAAGLITPITGKRLALSQNFDGQLSVAERFYRNVEAELGQSLFHSQPALRLFATREQHQIWMRRRDHQEYCKHLLSPQPKPVLDPTLGDVGLGGFYMHTAQLDVARFLAASESVLSVVHTAIDWHRDVTFTPEGCYVRGQQSDYVVSCEGFGARHNPYLSWLQFNAAKGDVLTVRFKQAMPRLTIHRGIWLAPTGQENVFKVGSTYDWYDLDQVPSQTARADIEARLRAFIHVPYDVIDHQAAVRPIVRESHPLIARHSAHPRLAVFNGLGSKGALSGPVFASRLADALVNDMTLPLAEAEARRV